MQRSKQEKSHIKSRILQYLENQGISFYAFYKDSGITRGILSQNTGISEDNIAKFLAYTHDISLAWLITGTGPMLRTELTITEPPATPEPPTPTVIYERDPQDAKFIASLEKTITAQEETIASQKKTIAQFEKLAAAKDEALAAKQEVIERDRLLAAAERKSTLYGRGHMSDAETTALDFAR